EHMADDYIRNLVQHGVISPDQLAEAEELSSSMGISINEALSRLGYVDEAELSRMQAQQYGFDFVNLDSIEIPPTVISLSPESVARENVVLTLELMEDRIRVALTNALDLEVLDKLRFILNREVVPVVASKDSIQNAINRHYGQTETESVDSMLAEFTETAID